MANVNPGAGAPPPALRRLGGAAKTFGPEYEFKLAGLVALRARRKRLRFQLYTNVAAARPADDIVLRVLQPEESTVFVQLKHSHAGAAATEKAFLTADGDFSLRKYYKFFAEFAKGHSSSGLSEDEKALHQCSLDDVRLVLFTNRAVPRRKGATDAPHLSFPHEDLFLTAGKTFSFGRKDAKLWELLGKDPQSDDYKEEFLPRLRVFGSQSHADDVDRLIAEELDALFGAPLPRTQELVADYVAGLREWAQNDADGRPLTERSGEVERALVGLLARRGRRAAGGGKLAFQPEH